MQRCQLAGWRDAKDRSIAAGAAILSSSRRSSRHWPELTLHMGKRRRTEREAVQRGQLAGWRDFKDRAVIAIDPAIHGRSVEVPVGGLHQSGA